LNIYSIFSYASSTSREEWVVVKSIKGGDIVFFSNSQSTGTKHRRELSNRNVFHVRIILSPLGQSPFFHKITPYTHYMCSHHTSREMIESLPSILFSFRNILVRLFLIHSNLLYAKKKWLLVHNWRGHCCYFGVGLQSEALNPK
jgi:hypothetical protein